DIAVFIGFAASGPLQTPVAIESEAQFEALFGRDAPLAWDVVRGEQVYAYLGPAVRAFFRNGGRRCWVIRVAKRDANDAGDLNRARYNYFPIPNLLRATFDENGAATLMPGFARARSEGSWSDSLTVGSALLTRPEQLMGAIVKEQGAYVAYVVRSANDDFAAGDLLRLTYAKGRYVLLLTVKDIESAGESPPLHSVRVQRLRCIKPLWFENVAVDSLAGPSAQVHLFTHQKPGGSEGELAACEEIYSASFAPDETANSDPDKPNTRAVLNIQGCDSADAPAPGSVVAFEIGGEKLWMTVETLAFNAAESSTSVMGRPIRLLTAQPALPITPPTCERLTFEIWVRKAEEYSVSLSDVGFEEKHERFWGSLPTDEALYQDLDGISTDSAATVLWRQVGDLFRFPLASVAGTSGVYFPLAMTGMADNFLGAVRLPGSELQRDGLAEFDARLFIDRDLISVTTETLASQAEFLLYLSDNPRKLTGIHAAYELEEPTIIAVPDAVHRGWSPGKPKAMPELPEFALPLRPEWWHFPDCRPQPLDSRKTLQPCDAPPAEDSTTKLVDRPSLGNFLNCSITEVEAPELSASSTITPNGTYTLSWTSSSADAGYILQEATVTSFDDAETIYSGKLNSFTIYGRKSGDYFYRVQAAVKQNISNWSNGVTVRVSSEDHWMLRKEEEYKADTLLAVQRALLRMCAARGDLFTLLTLPAEYREDKAIAHVALLKAPEAPALQGVSSLNSGETTDFSYGALYHPWLINGEGQEADSLRRIPPCGAVSGIFAHRALLRGAWIAPANEPMRGNIAIAPPISRERYLDIQNANINLVRQEPRGFIVLNSDTLSDDEDLRQISVRRLLILLRRLALRLGSTYVFEPHSPAFRRLVERGFTEMLDEMFVRGAFAGSVPRTAYQVVADESLNTAQIVDQGKFIVELRVAPSLPLTFVTIRFIQTGDRSFVTEVL
ncbi:MAG TPA: hypothetical protein VIW64_13300, partial [Pyrinomonadaceae bacterium]